MRKVARLSIIMLLMVVVLTVKVYAKPNCNMSMETKQAEVKKDQEITIDVNLSNIQSERGIIALEAVLEYDRDCLTLSKMEGQNSWHTPVKGLSYNESNGKLVMDKEGLAKSNETILEITFIAKETSQKDTTVSLKNIIVADGTAPAKIGTTYKKITIKDKEEKPNTKPTPDEGQKPSTKPSTDGEQKPSTKPSTNREQKPNTKPSTSEEEKTKPDTNTILGEDKESNTIANEEQETNTNVTSDENENTNKNQTIGNIDNKENIAPERNNNLIILLIILLLIIVITGTIMYKKSRSGKNTRM